VRRRQDGKGAGSMQWLSVADYAAMSAHGAARLYDVLAGGAPARRRVNVGLATGHTMIELYHLLAERLNRGRIRLDHVHTYHLDEYVDAGGRLVPADHPLSYRKYMRDHLFSRLDPALGFPEPHIHFPDPSDPARFDRELAAAGGLDLQLLGIGFNGHIGFNEPEDAAAVGVDVFAGRPSRVVELTARTRETNARVAAGGDLGIVPLRAVTMGMQPIVAAREILLLACFSEQQAPLQRMRQGRPTPELPASYLLPHPHATVVYTACNIHLI
jgi:glucosamine-6-phosphate deaminase